VRQRAARTWPTALEVYDRQCERDKRHTFKIQSEGERGCKCNVNDSGRPPHQFGQPYSSRQTLRREAQAEPGPLFAVSSFRVLTNFDDRNVSVQFNMGTLSAYATTEQYTAAQDSFRCRATATHHHQRDSKKGAYLQRPPFVFYVSIYQPVISIQQLTAITNFLIVFLTSQRRRVVFVAAAAERSHDDDDRRWCGGQRNVTGTL
jgi:hypothetical protein